MLPLHEYLEQLLAKKGLRKMDVIQASLLDRAYGYHIFSGTKSNPSRRKLLPLALAMHLDLNETQHLLRYAGETMLYPRNPWDSIIISAIQKRLSVKEANALPRSIYKADGKLHEQERDTAKFWLSGRYALLF